MDLRGSGWAKNDPSKKSKLARLRTSRARATDFGRGSIMRRSASAGLLRGPQQEAREQTSGWRRGTCIQTCKKTSTLYLNRTGAAGRLNAAHRLHQPLYTLDSERHWTPLNLKASSIAWEIKRL